MITSGEFGDELASNPHMSEIIKAISEIYDTGDKEVVYTKGVEYRSKVITSLPQSSLFIGSPNQLIYDEAVKKKFLLAFGSKLARRSFFCYVWEKIPKASYSSIAEMREAERQALEQAKIVQNNLREGIVSIAEYQLAQENALLHVDDNVLDVFLSYKRYNEELASGIDGKYPLSKLVREHLQWKALKLAGALAILACDSTLQESHYVDAIRLCEYLDQDMEAFERELIKEPYETFADYMSSIAVDNVANMTLHALRKSKYIPTTGDAIKRMKELAQLAASYDTEAVYHADEHGVTYERIVQVSELSISYKAIDNSSIYSAVASGNQEAITRAKNLVSTTANEGLEVAEMSFADIEDLLQQDYAYSPFVFKDGIRTKENLIPSTKWLVLDVDSSAITMEEAHFLLEDLNHYIASGSNKDNEFKFHIIVELDSVVTVDARTWKAFYLSVASELALKVDPLPQSQIFFSYSTSTILSTLDGSAIKVRDHLMKAAEEADKISVTRKLSQAQKDLGTSDPYITFNFAYECPNDGTGSRKLLGAARLAYEEYDMTKEQVEELVYSINNYWTRPMPEERVRNTIISQVSKW